MIEAKQIGLRSRFTGCLHRQMRLPCAVKVVDEQRVHRATRRCEETHPIGSCLIRQHVQRMELSMNRDHVECLETGREPPQMCRQARFDIGDVRDYILEACRDLPALVEVVGPPVDEELRVERLRELHGITGGFGDGNRLRRERRRPGRLTSVGPGSGKCGGEAAAGGAFGSHVTLVELRRPPARMQSELVLSARRVHGGIVRAREGLRAESR